VNLNLLLTGLVIGLVQGGLYGLIALGIVLVYKGSRVLNFAQAEIGNLALYVAALLSGDRRYPYWIGAVCAIGFALAVGLLFERLVVRRMVNAPRLSVAVATIGLFTFLLFLEFYAFGPTAKYLAPPISGKGIRIADVQVSPTQMLSFAVIAALALGLTAFLRFTDFGLGVRAAAQDSTAVRLVGVPLRRVSMFTWGAAAVLSAVAALLIQPTITTITPGSIGEPLLIGGLAAALLGGLDSLPGAFLGGVVVGVVINEVQFWVVAEIPWLVNVLRIQDIVLFAIVMAVLLLRPRGLLGSAAARAEMA
jgi:branched-chain amino acid transport system permease protein